MTLYQVLLVGAGGFAGSIARFVTVQSIDKKFNQIFPYGTLTVNLLGSLILGCVIGMMLKKPDLSPDWKLFLGTGFCGGFTTFSAFALENYSMLEQKFPGTSVLYISVSIVFGIVAIAAGVVIGRTI
jgi:fluoride exporter